MYRLVTEKAVHGSRLHQEDHNHEAGCQSKLNYSFYVNQPRLMLANKEHTHSHDTEPLSTFKVMPRKRHKESVKILVVTGPGRGGKLLKDILTNGGYDVAAVSDGNEGLELCKKNLAGYKKPRLFEFVPVDKFPRSTTGKILRHEVEKWHK